MSLLTGHVVGFGDSERPMSDWFEPRRVRLVTEKVADSGSCFPAGQEVVAIESLSPGVYLLEGAVPAPELIGGYTYDTFEAEVTEFEWIDAR